MTVLGFLVLAAAALVLWGAMSGPSPHRRSALEVAVVGAVVGALLLGLRRLSPRVNTLALNLRAPVNVKMGMIWAFTLGGVAAALAAVRGVARRRWWGASGRSRCGLRALVQLEPLGGPDPPLDAAGPVLALLRRSASRASPSSRS